MRTPAVLINPKAGRSGGKGRQLAEALSSRGQSKADVVVLESFAQLEPALQRFAAGGVTDLFISSGDGTVQAIQTWLAERKAFAVMPRLCLMPHGTTNMTAADIGFRQKTITEQVNAVLAPAPKETLSRHTLRVANPAHGKPQHGMFFGTGAVSEAARYCQTVFNQRGVQGSWATFATLASAVGRSLFSKPNPHDATRFDRPFPIKLRVNGETLADGQQLLMLATTLNKLILGSRPFWGGGSAPIRTTVMPYPLPSVWRWLIPAMYGSEGRTPPPGAISRAVDACEVSCPTPFVIDGEFHLPPDDAPLRIETGMRFEYIVR